TQRRLAGILVGTNLVRCFEWSSNGCCPGKPMTQEVDMNHERLAADSHDRTQSHLVEKACGHWEAQRKAAAARRDPSQLAPHSFTSALAREAGTDGSSVAREVGNRLGWCVYDHELLERVARDLGLRTILLESVDERRQSWLTEAFEVIMSSPGKSAWGPLVS